MPPFVFAWFQSASARAVVVIARAGAPLSVWSTILLETFV
jgi:hypothetical protein